MSKDNPFGDEGGARVGRPDTPKRDNLKPDNAKSDTVQGNDVKPHDIGDGHGGITTGAGAEAARGILDTNDSDANDSGSPAEPGSQPLADRANEHEPGYGGKGGEPRTSSDQR